MRREAFKIVEGQPTDANLHRITEDPEKLLYPIQFDKEGGKHNLIRLIMDKADYTKRFGAPFPRPNRPAIYDESISDGATSVVHAKAEALHCSRITNWDAFEAAEKESQSSIIDIFDKACYSEMYKPVTFYSRVTKRKMVDHLHVICVGKHAIDILEL